MLDTDQLCACVKQITAQHQVRILVNNAGAGFDEARKYGVKVVTIFPDMTQTNLYRNADFREGDETESYLLPEDVAGAVESILGQREEVIVTDITLKPQLHRMKRKLSKENDKGEPLKYF